MSDLISRQEVKEILRTEWVKLFPMELDPYLSLAMEKIENIPPAEPKKGKWEKQLTRHFLDSRANVGVEMKEATGRGYHIYVNLKCTNCNKVTMVSESIIYKFCPHCGAEMTLLEPNEEEVKK